MTSPSSAGRPGADVEIGMLANERGGQMATVRVDGEDQRKTTAVAKAVDRMGSSAIDGIAGT
eukprot:CAMPEP_0113593758 /NCGR_PEP_ID=MMETSP0015_2-20120614/38643_1 /TAXON_ID=2838 /ORGANISM="Odontella" /LENGTH=61 /DNA_ID=CAMNT_0000500567 /DNA_START=107 /DNA_END=288 /DNA_ORIENTATION=- /assembly_acc=CAM_ASM_000160